MNALTNAVTIEVVATGKTFHTLRDWGLAIENNDIIGEPEMEEYYVDVPGADGFLDFTEVVTGRRIFKSRPITIKLGGKKPRNYWDNWIGGIRNQIHGQIVKIIPDNDSAYYYTGRAKVIDFNRTRELGTFTLSIPKADPYKYQVEDNMAEDWLWDTFDFETGTTEGEGRIINLSGGSDTYTIEPGEMPFVPTILVDSVGGSGLKMEVDGENYTLVKGRNRFADIVVDTKKVSMKFSGTGKLSVRYRRGSL